VIKRIVTPYFIIGLACWIIVGHVLNTLNASGWQIVAVFAAMIAIEWNEAYFTRKKAWEDSIKMFSTCLAKKLEEK
jgi:hypothetical protein